MRHACKLCGHHDSIRNLITPCEGLGGHHLSHRHSCIVTHATVSACADTGPTCAKRDDTLLCHAQCLLRHIEASVQHRIDTSEQEAATCATCGRPYQLKWRWRCVFFG